MTDKPLDPIIIIDEAAKIDPAVMDRLVEVSCFMEADGTVSPLIVHPPANGDAIAAARKTGKTSRAEEWFRGEQERKRCAAVLKGKRCTQPVEPPVKICRMHGGPPLTMKDAPRAIFDARVHENPDRIVP